MTVPQPAASISSRQNRVPEPPRRTQLALFAKNFFRHPRMLGSLIPSSSFLINRVLGQVDWQRARVIVEYGPGVGTITREVLRRMRPDATLIVFETNEEFVAFLRDSIPDPRLEVVHGSAGEVGSHLGAKGLRADYVISGIPFSTIPEGPRGEILRATQAALQPDGAFLVYQFSPNVLPHLEETFSSVERSFEPFNVLPAQLFYCVP